MTATTFDKNTASWADLAAGLALLYMDPDGEPKPNEYLIRLAFTAMETNKKDKLVYVTSLLIGRLFLRGTLEPWMADYWEYLRERKATIRAVGE